jgi:hypothetical protein
MTGTLTASTSRLQRDRRRVATGSPEPCLPVTLSNENTPSRSRRCPHPEPVGHGRQQALHGRLAAVSAALSPGLPSGRSNDGLSRNPQDLDRPLQGLVAAGRRHPRRQDLRQSQPGPRLQERTARPGRRRLLDRPAPRPHPVRRVGRPPVAALGLQPTAQPQGHGDHRKPPTLPPAPPTSAAANSARSPPPSCSAGNTSWKASSATAA